jgi:hypothetical protein
MMLDQPGGGQAQAQIMFAVAQKPFVHLGIARTGIVDRRCDETEIDGFPVHRTAPPSPHPAVEGGDEIPFVRAGPEFHCHPGWHRAAFLASDTVGFVFWTNGRYCRPMIHADRIPSTGEIIAGGRVLRPSVDVRRAGRADRHMKRYDSVATNEVR